MCDVALKRSRWIYFLSRFVSSLRSSIFFNSNSNIEYLNIDKLYWTIIIDTCVLFGGFVKSILLEKKVAEEIDKNKINNHFFFWISATVLFCSAVFFVFSWWKKEKKKDIRRYKIPVVVSTSEHEWILNGKIMLRKRRRRRRWWWWW